MAEYIERQELCKAVKSVFSDMPAAEVATVVHGRWEWHGPCRDSNGKFWATCSVCKVRQRLGDYGRFCPYCGAKMDGGEKANE